MDKQCLQITNKYSKTNEISLVFLFTKFLFVQNSTKRVPNFALVHTKPSSGRKVACDSMTEGSIVRLTSQKMPKPKYQHPKGVLYEVLKLSTGNTR